MFCKYCGNKIESDAIFCSKCGKRLSSDDGQEKPAQPGTVGNSAIYDTSREAVEPVKTDELVIVEQEIQIRDESQSVMENEAYFSEEKNGDKSVPETKTLNPSELNVSAKILVAILGIATLVIIGIFCVRSINAFSRATNSNQQYISDIDCLIENGKDVSVLLHTAVASTAPAEAVQKLIDAGANVDVTDSKGRTPLMYGGTRPLIDAGANINAQDENGLTPLMWAVINENFLQARILVEKGADTSIKDNKGLTAFDIAALYKYNEIDSGYLDFLK